MHVLLANPPKRFISTTFTHRNVQNSCSTPVTTAKYEASPGSKTTWALRQQVMMVIFTFTIFIGKNKRGMRSMSFSSKMLSFLASPTSQGRCCLTIFWQSALIDRFTTQTTRSSFARFLQRTNFQQLWSIKMERLYSQESVTGQERHYQELFRCGKWMSGGLNVITRSRPIACLSAG